MFAKIEIFNKIIQLVNQNLDSSLTEIIAVSNTTLDVFLVLAAGGVFVQIGLNWKNGGDIWGYIQWIPLLGFLMVYGEFVSGLVTSSSSVKFDLGINLMDFIQAPPNKIDLNPANMVGNAVDTMKMFFLSLIVTIVNVIAMLAFIYVKMKVIFKVALLIFIAPINISLSFIPALGHLWQGALLKAIEVALYVPALLLIDWIGKNVFLASIKSSVIEKPSDIGQAYVNMEIGIFFYGMVAISYFSVPSLVGWVLDSGGGASTGGLRKMSASIGALAKKMI